MTYTANKDETFTEIVHSVCRRIADERIHLLLEQAAGHAMRQWGPGAEYDFLTTLAKGFNK